MRTINGRSSNTTAEWSYFPQNTPAVFSLSQGLLDYVLTEGFNHLGYLGSASHTVLEDMMALQSDIQNHPAAWEKIRRMLQGYKLVVPWPGLEHDFMLYLLTAFGSRPLLDAFLGPTRRVLKSRYQTNPLVYAAHFGRPKHAQLLLSRGAKVNEKGLVVEGHRQALPLEVAVSRQHDGMVDLLLSTGSVVPGQLFTRTTDRNFPIRIARRLLQTDEFAGWAAEPGNKLPSPIGLLERQLPLAYERDIIVMIRRLVQVGLDPVARNSAQKTALHLAIAGGYQAVVVYLLLIGTPLPFDFMSTLSRITSSERIYMLRLIVDAGADARVGEDITLHLAVKSFEEDESLEVVRILLEAGYNPSVYDGARRTPLDLALERRYLSVADHLLLQQRPACLDTMLTVMNSGCPTPWITKTIQTLIDGGADIHGITGYGDGLLHRAVGLLDERKGLEMCQFLVAAGCDPFKRNVIGQTPLDLALGLKSSLLAGYILSTGGPFPPDVLLAVMKSGRPTPWITKTIQTLIDGGADIHGITRYGDGLLHRAVGLLDECKRLDMCQLLVAAGCDPFKPNVVGQTPLDLALGLKSPLLAGYILSTGGPFPPDVLLAVMDSGRPTPWITKTIQTLINGGADIHGITGYGDGLLHRAVGLLDERKGLEMSQLLVSAGCDPFKPNVVGKTPLDLALGLKSPLLAEYILSTGGPFPPDVLFAVLRSSHPADWKFQTIRSLTGKGVDVRALSANGNTLLHAIAFTLHGSLALDVTRFVVGAGCDLSILNRQEKTVLHIVAERGCTFVMKYILALDQALPDNILFSVLKSHYSQVPMLRMLISKGANAGAVSVDGNNLLHTAISSPALLFRFYPPRGIAHMQTVVEILLKGGCDAFAPDSRGKTPLHLAVLKGYVPIVECLLSITPLPHLPVDILVSALDGDKAQRNPKDTCTILQVLIGKGADVRAPAVNGGTLLHMAIKNGRRPRTTLYDHLLEREDLDIIQLLVNAGCDPSRCDADGHSPVYFAITQGFVDTVNYLLPRTTPLPRNLLSAVNLSPYDVRPELQRLLTLPGSYITSLYASLS